VFECWIKIDNKKRVKMYLFYPGEEYISINNVKVIPVAGIFRGQ